MHSDSHDVFVFQTAGTKQWEVYDGDERLDVLLEPGLSMYLPTGTPHAARAQDTVSLHVTIGINQLTWRGLVRRSVEQALREVDEAHLPAGYLADPTALTAGLADRLQALAEDVRRLDPATAVNSEVTRFLTTRPSRLRGGLHDVLAEVADTTSLARRRTTACVLVDADDGLRVLLGDRVLTVPTRLRPALELIAAVESLVPKELAHLLDEQSRVVLCRRLVREGLLEVRS